MTKLRAALMIQLAFFTLWAYHQFSMNITANPDEIYLETPPLDPRDLLSGTYVALNYAIGNPQAASCRDLPMNPPGLVTSVFVRLQKSSKTVMVKGKPLPIYEAADCRSQPPFPPNGLWARGYIYRTSWRDTRVLYGIEKFFINENDPLKDARSGSVTAQVKLDRLNNMRIENLFKIDGN